MALIKLNSRAIPDSTVVNTDIADGSVTQAKIVDGSISSAKIASDAVTTAKIANTVNLGRRNLLINGNFDVWQRATSYTDVAGIWKYGHADRWNGHNDGANAGTWSQSTVVPNAGSTYSMLMTGASTVTNTNFSQRIESTSLKGIRERNSFTVSGYVRSATAGKVIHCHALCPTATDNYAGYTQHNLVMSSVTISGNGGAGTSQITLTDANTWYYFTMTKTSATSLTNFDKGYAVFFGIIGQTSTSHQVYMSQLQVEAGDTATPFEHRSFGEELSLCRRYFCKTYNYADAVGSVGSGYWAWTKTTSQRWDIPLYQGHGMRSTPTIVAYNASTGTAGQYRNASNGTNHTVAAFQATQNMLFIDENYGNWNNLGAGSVGRMFVTADAEL